MVDLIYKCFICAHSLCSLVNVVHYLYLSTADKLFKRTLHLYIIHYSIYKTEETKWSIWCN